MKLRMLLLIVAVMVAANVSVHAQVGIGTTNPDVNSILDITSTDKGVLLPRVALTGTRDVAPLSAHVAGMKVYNTATFGTAPYNVTPGVYYNDGTKWIRVGESTTSFESSGLVFVDTADPNTATMWGEDPYYQYDAVSMGCVVNPAFTNDPSLEADTSRLYIGHSGTCMATSDGSEYSYWIYDGTNYVSYTKPDSSVWYLGGTQLDAGSDKISRIQRNGSVGIGYFGGTDHGTKLLVGHKTADDPLSSSITSGTLTGITVNNQHDHTNTISMTGISMRNFQNSSSTMANNWGTNYRIENYGGRISDMRGIYTRVKATSQSDGLLNGRGAYIEIKNESDNTVASGNLYGIEAINEHTGEGNISNQIGIKVSNVNNLGAGGVSNIQRGMDVFNLSRNFSAPGLTLSSLDGAHIHNELNSDQTITRMAALSIENQLSPLGQGTLTDLYGVYLLNDRRMANGTTVTNSYGFYYDTTDTGVIGIATNDYGIYLEDVGNDVGDYAIYSAGGKVHFDGLTGYASDAAAGAAGLVAGDLYQTNGHASLPNGVVMVKQ